MKILNLNTRRWTQVELIGVTENTDGDYGTRKALCIGFANNIVIEAKEGVRA